MAEGKKSFILYADMIHSLEHLTYEEKGILFQHLLEFVNDMNPVLTDRLILTAWKPIELSLKRDLKKFETTLEERSYNGRLGNLKRWNKDLYNLVLTKELTIEDAENIAKTRKLSHSDSYVSQTIPNITDNDNDSDNDNDNDNDILLEKETKNNLGEISNFEEIEVLETEEIKKEKSSAKKDKKFNFKSALLDYGFDTKLVDEWLQVRKEKRAVNTETAFNAFITEIESRQCNINDMLRIAVEKSWSGFKHKWVDNLNLTKQNYGNTETRTESNFIGRMSEETVKRNLQGW